MIHLGKDEKIKKRKTFPLWDFSGVLPRHTPRHSWKDILVLQQKLRCCWDCYLGPPLKFLPLWPCPADPWSCSWGALPRVSLPAILILFLAKSISSTSTLEFPLPCFPPSYSHTSSWKSYPAPKELFRGLILPASYRPWLSNPELRERSQFSTAEPRGRRELGIQLSLLQLWKFMTPGLPGSWEIWKNTGSTLKFRSSPKDNSQSSKSTNPPIPKKALFASSVFLKNSEVFHFHLQIQKRCFINGESKTVEPTFKLYFTTSYVS